MGDRTRGILANASNVIDPTWEAPDGTIVPLDGFLDPYFQEVYLDAESIPLFTRLVAGIGADAVDDYVEQLEHEVWKYTVVTPNHGKAARRMYNVFRLSGRYPEAAYLRELFDEPVTALYQLAALLQTVADAATTGDEVFDRELLLAQVDQLIMSAIAALDGPDEALMVERLRRFREAIAVGEERRRDDRRARPGGHVDRPRRGAGRGRRLLPAGAAGRAEHRGLPRRARRPTCLKRRPDGRVEQRAVGREAEEGVAEGGVAGRLLRLPEHDARSLAMGRAASATVRTAASKSGWSSCPRMPSACDRSAGPTNRTSMPSMAAMSAAAATPSRDSTWTMPTIVALRVSTESWPPAP